MTPNNKNPTKKPKFHWSPLQVAQAPTLCYAKNWSISENNQAFNLPFLYELYFGVTKEWKPPLLQN